MSLSSERAADSKHAATQTAPPSPPAEPADSDEAESGHEDEDDRVTESDVSPTHHNEAESVESEAGPSAADILSALEQAYQRQVAASVVSAAEAEPVVAEAAPAAELAAESVTPGVESDSVVPGQAADERVAEVEAEPRAADDLAPAASVQVAAPTRAEQNHETVQQIAVVYQPVYVLPSANPNRQTHTSPPRRQVGRDPWAPVTISPRHNPWATNSVSGGAWATIGVAGGVWAGTSAPRR